MCPRCLSQRLRVLEVPSRIVVTACRVCGAVRSGGRWSRDRAALIREISRQVKLNPTIDGKTPRSISSSHFSLEVIPDLRRGIVTLIARHSAGAPVFEERKTVELRVVEQTCPDCSLLHGGHYEAIIQLRGERDVRRVLDRVLAQAESERTSRDFVVKVDRVKNGWDLYTSSLRLARKLATFLRRNGLSIKQSRKLVGQTKDGRRRYRFTFSARVGS